MKSYFVYFDEYHFFQVTCDRLDESSRYYYFFLGDVIVCDISKYNCIKVELFEEK